jgi:hypothetical protein
MMFKLTEEDKDDITKKRLIEFWRMCIRNAIRPCDTPSCFRTGAAILEVLEWMTTPEEFDQFQFKWHDDEEGEQ